MEALYLGVDFHPHQQTVVWCEPATGELKSATLWHQECEVVRAFYAALPPGIVGIEATTQADWFAALLAETGHQVWVGHPTRIRARARSRHKSDQRDAELLYDLLRTGEFPRLWQRPAASQAVLDILHLRQRLVRQRTQTYNRLQALAHRCGLPKGRLVTQSFQAQLKACRLNDTQELVRAHWFKLLAQLTTQLAELELWLQQRANRDNAVQRLCTQKGVGYLTALTVVHSLGDVQRFPRLSKQVALLRASIRSNIRAQARPSSAASANKATGSCASNWARPPAWRRAMKGGSKATSKSWRKRNRARWRKPRQRASC
jgi:transposase